MTNLLSSRDYLKIQEAAEALGVSEQTLRNWDKAGKLKARRHPINGYRLYRASDLHELLEQITPEDRLGSQLSLDLPTALADGGPSTLPPSHWSAAVALDPKHRPQRWDSVASTVRRDWRKAPQEAYVMDAQGKAYRRLTVEEIAILQGFSPDVVNVKGLTARQRTAALGDAVPPPLARAVLQGVDSVWTWKDRSAVEICAGIGGLAEGAAAIGLEHELLIDLSPTCGALLRHGRRWDPEAVRVGDVRAHSYEDLRSGVGLLSGGPPCQPWSQAGRHLAQNDSRDLLGHLDEIVRVVEPEVFVFENVPGLAAAGNVNYLRHVVDRLRRPGRDLAYGVMVGLLNAADYGVPQVRRRIFIIGFRDRPSSFASHCFDAIERSATHCDPSLPRGNRQPWRTVGEAIGHLPDPGGWRRWIGVRE